MTHPTCPSSGSPDHGGRAGRPALNPRAAPHAETCPDCGSAEIITDDVHTTDGHTEIAFVCLDCDTIWPLTCLTGQAAAEGSDR